MPFADRVRTHENSRRTCPKDSWIHAMRQKEWINPELDVQAAKLDLFYLRPDNHVGWAWVDSPLTWILSRWTWYAAGPRQTRPPRTILRLAAGSEGPLKQHNLSLPRLVYVLSEEASPEDLASDLPLLLQRHHDCPKLWQRNRDLLDYRRVNLRTVNDTIGIRSGPKDCSIDPAEFDPSSLPIPHSVD
jgi:hypothetical protein